MNGSTGSDYLTGGGDSDTFAFTNAAFGADTIVDWQDNFDEISILSTLVASPPLLGTQFSNLTFTGNGTTSVIVRGFLGTGSAIIVKADTAFTLDESDFVFV